MFGRGYMVENCIALFKKEQERTVSVKSLVYIANGIEKLTNGLAEREILPSFAEYMEDKPEDTRTAKEVVNDVLTKCGLLRGVK